jgi:hypothetical protein
MMADWLPLFVALGDWMVATAICALLFWVLR